MIRTLRIVGSVAIVGLREILRDKILYNVLLIAVLLMGLGFLASRLTFVTPDRVILDFGVSAVNLSLAAISILLGSSILNREIERRTIFLALSRPISRFHFVTGKYLGLVAALFLNWLLVSGAFLLILYFTGASESSSFTLSLFQALVLTLFQSFILGGVSFFFSSVSKTSLSVVMATGTFLIGNNVSQILELARKAESVMSERILDFVAFVFPNLEHFNLGTHLTYGIPVSGRFLFFAVTYSLAVSALTVALAGLLLKWKEG